jgi:hypothetical protein
VRSQSVAGERRLGDAILEDLDDVVGAARRHDVTLVVARVTAWAFPVQRRSATMRQ